MIPAAWAPCSGVSSSCPSPGTPVMKREGDDVSHSVVSNSATPWTVARQAPLSMEFSRQECCSGLPFPSPGIFPIRGSSPGLLHGRQILYRLSHREALPVMGKPLRLLFLPMSLINRSATWQRLDFSIILVHTYPESLVFHPSQTGILYFYQFSYSFFPLDVNANRWMLMINWASLV